MSTMVDLSNMRQSFNTKVTGMEENISLLIPLGWKQLQSLAVNKGGFYLVVA